jgi:fatty-acyl-CoA synthase
VKYEALMRRRMRWETPASAAGGSHAEQARQDLIVNPYEDGLGKNPANYVPLSPLSFIARAAEVFPDKVALIHGAARQTWAETYRRCCKLASALRRRGIGAADTVAVIAPNTPAMYEAHFGVPMSGAVLNTINIRLDSGTIAFLLEHGAAKV